jgi:hypothetical protein
MKSLVISFFQLAAVLATASGLSAVAGRDLRTDINPKTGVATCTQKDSKCAVTINAVGDVVKLDVKTATATDLGTISAETKKTINLPKEGGSNTLYSLTPTEGESKGKKIYVVFENKVQPKGSRLFGQTVIMAYRQFEGEKSNQWVEVGRITSNVPLESADVTLMPDGVAKVANPMNPEETIIFNVGKKDFKA